MRSRFKSTWNSIATVIFIIGIFMGNSIFGFPAVGVAIAMWVLGGAVTNILFGPKHKESISGAASPQRDYYVQNQYNTPNTNNLQPETSPTQTCPSCGSLVEQLSNFCGECGTKIETPVK